MIKSGNLVITVDGSKPPDARRYLLLSGSVSLSKGMVINLAEKSHAIYGLFNPEKWYVVVHDSNNRLRGALESRICEHIDSVLKNIPSEAIENEYRQTRAEFLLQEMYRKQTELSEATHAVQEAYKLILPSDSVFDFKAEDKLDADSQFITNVDVFQTTSNGVVGFEIESVSADYKTTYHQELTLDTRDAYKDAFNPVKAKALILSTIPYNPERSDIIVKTWRFARQRLEDDGLYSDLLSIKKYMTSEYAMAARLIAFTDKGEEIHYIIINNGIARMAATVRINNVKQEFAI